MTKMTNVSSEELLKRIVRAWDDYRLGDVAVLVTQARVKFGIPLPAKNKDR